MCYNKSRKTDVKIFYLGNKMMQLINHLDRTFIQNYVGLLTFQRGEEYAKSGAIRQGKWKHHLLSALCQGREFNPYHVEVLFDQEGIEHSYCSCPVGGGGKCKHVVALLLTWLENPERFTQWEELREHLTHYQMSDLLELIDLLEAESEKSFEIIQAFQKNLSATKSPRLAKYTQQIEEAFHPSEFPWYHPEEGEAAEIAFKLDKIRADLQDFFKEGPLKESIYLERYFIQKVLDYVEEHSDPWNYFQFPLNGSISRLNQALFLLKDQPDLRLKIFQTLFQLVEEQFYRKKEGGAEKAKEVLLLHVQSQEKGKILSWVQALEGEKQGFPEERTLLEDFLMDLQKETLEPAVYLDYYKKTDQPLKLVESLLELNRVEEAAQVAKQEQGEEALSLANLFLKHGHPELAEKLVEENLKASSSLQALHWLQEFYQERGEQERALKHAKEILFLSLEFRDYQRIRERAQRMGIWPLERQEILEQLRTREEAWELLVEIYLDEKILEEAIEIFEKSSFPSFYSFQHPSYALLALRLAIEARYSFPLFALKIYQNLVQNLIEERSRESYRRACHHLKTIHSLYRELKQPEKWTAYVNSLRQTYRRLKAFMDELNQMSF